MAQSSPYTVEADNNREPLEIAGIDNITKISPKYHQSCTKLLCFLSPERSILMVAA
jgi:hypothetical protein